MSEENISGEIQEAAVPQNQPVEAQPPAQEEKGEQQVPLSALQAERAHRQQIEETLQFYKENYELAKANIQQKPAQQQEEQGFSDNDVLTYGEAKKAFSQTEKQLQLSIAELRMSQKYPDYEEVIKNHLPEVIKTNPKLQKTLFETQDYELAYYLAKTSDGYRNETKKKSIHADAERIVQNSQKAGSLSSTGSSSTISQAKRYKEMSDSDFMKEVNKNLGIF
jgi:hypothetical protein